MVTDFRQGGIWGTGMSIQMEPPHAVLHVDDLQDSEGCNCNHLVAVGDQLLKVNNVLVQSADIDALEAVILGPVDSMVKLSFCSSGQDSGYSTPPFYDYDINVKRHIPINPCDQVVRWYELKPEFRDKDFLAENKIVKVIFQCFLMCPFVHKRTLQHASMCKRPC